MMRLAGVFGDCKEVEALPGAAGALRSSSPWSSLAAKRLSRLGQTRGRGPARTASVMDSSPAVVRRTVPNDRSGLQGTAASDQQEPFGFLRSMAAMQRWQHSDSKTSG